MRQKITGLDGERMVRVQTIAQTAHRALLYYQPPGSIWYFPQAYRNDQHGKLLLMAPGKDRAGTLGFRCVVDAALER